MQSDLGSLIDQYPASKCCQISVLTKRTTLQQVAVGYTTYPDVAAYTTYPDVQKTYGL